MKDRLIEIMQYKIDALDKAYCNKEPALLKITDIARNKYISELCKVLEGWQGAIDRLGVEKFRETVKSLMEGMVYTRYGVDVFDNNNCMNGTLSNDSLNSFGHHNAMLQGDTFQTCDKMIELDIDREMVHIICGLLYEISKGDTK